MKATFIHDSGHGWLSVSKKDVATLGIVDKISSFSYMSNSRVYLEEDCDASLFIETAKQKNIEVTTKTGKYLNRASCRSYPCFDRKWFYIDIKKGLKVEGSQGKIYEIIDIVASKKIIAMDNFGNVFKACSFTKFMNVGSPLPEV